MTDRQGSLYYLGVEAPRLPGVERLYRQHHPFVWRVLRSLGVPNDGVEDAVQDVFMVVFRRHSEFDASGSTTALLFGIARRVAQRYREQAKRSREPVELGSAGPQTTPEDVVAQMEAADLVRNVLDAMDDDKRVVFVLADVEGVTAPEIARWLGVKLNTVYSRLRAGRELMRRAIGRHQAAVRRGRRACGT